MRKALAAAALAALAVAPAAAAHGGGGALGFRSQVTRVTPAVPGVTVRVLDYDDRLELVNRSGKPLLILGYQGEPYLAFRGGRVYRNARSPATYLNEERFGEVALPPDADPKAPPRWEQVAPRERYEWHDHRIHWMSSTLPPVVRAAPDRAHHVFDWTVPGVLGGRPFRITGTLGYVPPRQGLPAPLAGALALVALGAVAAAALRLRRTRRSRP